MADVRRAIEARIAEQRLLIMVLELEREAWATAVDLVDGEELPLTQNLG